MHMRDRVPHSNEAPVWRAAGNASGEAVEPCVLQGGPEMHGARACHRPHGGERRMIITCAQRGPTPPARARCFIAVRARGDRRWRLKRRSGERLLLA